MNKPGGTKLQLPPTDKLEAVEALLKLSGAYVRQDVLKSLSNAIRAKSQAENPPIRIIEGDSTMTLQEKKDLIWKLWVPDIRGWRKMMKKHVLDERMYNRLQMYFFRARRMLKEELEEVDIQHAHNTVN